MKLTKSTILGGGGIALLSAAGAYYFFKSNKEHREGMDPHDFQEMLASMPRTPKDSFLIHTLSPIEISALNMNSVWLDLVIRLYDCSYGFNAEFNQVVKAIARALEYHACLQFGVIPMTIGKPRVFHAFLHTIIENLRLLRHHVHENGEREKGEEFDEICSDIQREHDTLSTNVLMDAMLVTRCK